MFKIQNQKTFFKKQQKEYLFTAASTHSKSLSGGTEYGPV